MYTTSLVELEFAVMCNVSGQYWETKKEVLGYLLDVTPGLGSCGSLGEPSNLTQSILYF